MLSLPVVQQVGAAALRQCYMTRATCTACGAFGGLGELPFALVAAPAVRELNQTVLSVYQRAECGGQQLWQVSHHTCFVLCTHTAALIDC